MVSKITNTITRDMQLEINEMMYSGGCIFMPFAVYTVIDHVPPTRQTVETTPAMDMR